jgi:serine/threonine-protein kinase
MASVYLGRLVRPQGFAKTVVLKRLHERYAKDETSLALFRDEARLAARIQHPNVVSTLDVLTDEGDLFLVMEYVEGESLAQLLASTSPERRPLDPAIAIAIATQVLHGLHAAHEARGATGERLSIVHRDVSPQNVLVGVDGVARLIDFGIAKAAGRSRTTDDGVVKGKVGYMAPEQAFGAATIQSDVFSASVVLWEALTGRHLFDESTPGATLNAVLHGAIPAPSAVRPSLPAALDEVVLKGLERDPQRRWPDAPAMAHALESVTAPAPIAAVGRWVRSTAEVALLERARQVAEMDGASSAPGAAGATGVTAGAAGAAAIEGPRAENPDRETAAFALDFEASKPAVHASSVHASSGHASADPASAVEPEADAPRDGVRSPPRSRGARWLVGVAFVLAAAGSAAAWSRASRHVAIAPASSGASAPATSAPPEASNAPEPTPAAVLVEASAADATEPSVSTPVAPAPAPRATAKPRSRPRPRSNARASCAQPYTFDSAGMKHYRPECL